MGREIKFKCWNKEEKRLMSHKEMTECVSLSYGESFDKDVIENYPMMQYTGLKDKNDDGDCDVYECDILEDGSGSRYTVIFNKGRFVAKHNKDGRMLRLDKVLNERNAIVVGNTHEKVESK